MYEYSISHDGLGKFRIIRARSRAELDAKAQELLHTWEEQWERKKNAEKTKDLRARTALDKQEKTALAAQLTVEAEQLVAELGTILQATFRNRYPDVWESMIDRRPFPTPRPLPPEKPSYPEVTFPGEPDRTLVPPKPLPNDLEFRPRFSLLDSLLPGWKQKRIHEAEQLFRLALTTWKGIVRDFNEKVEDHNNTVRGIKENYQKAKIRIHENYKIAVSSFERDLAMWESQKSTYESDQEAQIQSVMSTKAAYGLCESEAVEEYCGAIMARSKYPEYCPQNFEMQYVKEAKILLVDYYFPKVEDIPTVKSVRYIQAQDKFVESPLSESSRNKLFEDATYQIALRTLHELFEADVTSALDSIVFNGIVETVDKATGRKVTPCILSVQVSKRDFELINLHQVEPKSCFKKLKGVSAARLHTLTPIAPVARMDREDRRFVDAYDVAASLDDSVNLAALDWEDFEHLVRELFAQEFSTDGGEVKVTQSSRDGGVDAVAFDPDPIRGGKIVIQAKRYTNVVGVSAVRDLWGTVQHEGANKGILVTTSHYGSDAFNFAKGKPITLLDGGNLLSLLAKHGHKAKIDIQAAKKEIGGRSEQK